MSSPYYVKVVAVKVAERYIASAAGPNIPSRNTLRRIVSSVFDKNVLSDIDDRSKGWDLKTAFPNHHGKAMEVDIPGHEYSAIEDIAFTAFVNLVAVDSAAITSPSAPDSYNVVEMAPDHNEQVLLHLVDAVNRRRGVTSQQNVRPRKRGRSSNGGYSDTTAIVDCAIMMDMLDHWVSNGLVLLSPKPYGAEGPFLLGPHPVAGRWNLARHRELRPTLLNLATALWIREVLVTCSFYGGPVYEMVAHINTLFNVIALFPAHRNHYSAGVRFYLGFSAKVDVDIGTGDVVVSRSSGSFITALHFDLSPTTTTVLDEKQYLKTKPADDQIPEFRFKVLVRSDLERLGEMVRAAGRHG